MQAVSLGEQLSVDIFSGQLCTSHGNKQEPFISVVLLVVSALSAREPPEEVDDGKNEPSSPNSDHIKAY